MNLEGGDRGVHVWGAPDCRGSMNSERNREEPTGFHVDSGWKEGTRQPAPGRRSSWGPPRRTSAYFPTDGVTQCPFRPLQGPRPTAGRTGLSTSRREAGLCPTLFTARLTRPRRGARQPHPVPLATAPGVLALVPPSSRRPTDLRKGPGCMFHPGFPYTVKSSSHSKA